MKLEFDVPDIALDVVRTAVDMIVSTMTQGAAVNAEGSWCNKEPLQYHVNKGMHHILRLWHEQDLLALEANEPHMSHLSNGFTRFAMAETLRRQKEPKPAILVESTDE